jgi:hypothetical protein
MIEPVPVEEFIKNRRAALAGKAITKAELDGVIADSFERARQDEIKIYIRQYYFQRHARHPAIRRARYATCRYWIRQLRRRRALWRG